MVSARDKRWAIEPTNVINLNEDMALESRTRQFLKWAEKKEAAKLGKIRNKTKRIPEFFNTKEWKQLRYKILKRDDGKCQCCGVSAKQGAVMNVDHIKPRLKYPELSMKMSNLQTLCAECNRGKGGRDETDWR